MIIKRVTFTPGGNYEESQCYTEGVIIKRVTVTLEGLIIKRVTVTLRGDYKESHCYTEG